jgi:hypothetical protein
MVETVELSPAMKVRIRGRELSLSRADVNPLTGELARSRRRDRRCARIPLKRDVEASVLEDRVLAEVVRPVHDVERIALRRPHLRTRHVERDAGDRALGHDERRGSSNPHERHEDRNG